MKAANIIYLIAFALVNSIQGQIISNGVSCNDKWLIVNLHNSMREQLAKGSLEGQPKASNMQQIVWDDQLEKLAQNWANSMQFDHNQNRKDSRFSVGENIYLSWSTIINKTNEWNDVVKAWFNEHKIYTYNPMFDIKTGHYTQVIWADSLYIGCGFTFYKKEETLYKSYVCNYGPAGNVQGQHPYETGPGCENLCCTNQCKKLYGEKC